MGKRKSDSVSLDALDPLELDPTRANIETVRRGVAKLHQKLAIWEAVLATLEQQAGIPSAAQPRVLHVPHHPPKSETDLPDVVRRRARGGGRYVEPSGQLLLYDDSWADRIYSVLQFANRPVSHSYLRSELIKAGHNPDGPNERTSYYSSIQRLKLKGHCVSYKGYFATPAALKKFKEDVAAGRTQDLHERRYTSRWIDAILTTMRKHGDWISGREIITALEAMPEFKAQKNVQSQVYAMMKRMLYVYKIAEKMGRAKDAKYRLLPEEDSSGFEGDRGETTMEGAAASTATH